MKKIFILLLALPFISGCSSGNEISVEETEITESTESIVSSVERSIVKESSPENKTESIMKESPAESKTESREETKIEISEFSEISIEETKESSAESMAENKKELPVEEKSQEESISVSNMELVGFYKLKDTTPDGENFINMERYDEAGLHVTLEIFADGTGEFKEYGDFSKITWNDRYIILDDEKAEYAMLEDKLALYSENTTLVFERTDKPEITKEESPETQELSGYIDEEVTGRYILTKMTGENQFEDDVYLTLNADGTGMMESGSQKIEIDWDDGEIEVNGEIFYYETDGNSIIADIYGIYATFERI